MKSNLKENDLLILDDYQRNSDGIHIYHGQFVWDVFEKINNIFFEKWGYFPCGGKDRNKIHTELGYNKKRDLKYVVACLFPKHYDETMVHCKWCESIGLDPIHPLSWITEHKGRNGSCRYMSRYRNSLRTKEELSTGYGADFEEIILRMFRENVLHETVLTEGELKSKCFEKYNNKCFKCGSITDLAIDHILPLSWFWAKSLKNIIPLCKSCNSSKGAKWPNEYYNEEELQKLSEVTEYSLIELQIPTYNYAFVDWVDDNMNVVREKANKRKKGDLYWDCFEKRLKIAKEKRIGGTYFI